LIMGVNWYHRRSDRDAQPKKSLPHLKDRQFAGKRISLNFIGDNFIHHTRVKQGACITHGGFTLGNFP